MVYLIILWVITAAASVFLTVKIVLMRKSMKEISAEFSEKVRGDTNTLITVSSRDRAVLNLADEINGQLRELRRQRLRFLQGDTELKNAITNISHDLRTPLTAICSYLDLLEETEKSQEVSRYTEIIKGRAQAMKRLTEELFRYSVILLPGDDKEKENVVINSVLEDSLAEFYAALIQRSIVPTVKITEKQIVRSLNKAALSRIFANVISNALKYSDKDLTVRLKDTGEIVFSNTAEKLNEVQVGRLFHRFYTVEASMESTGLGLSIARTLTEQMKGVITAKYQNKRLSIIISFPENPL